MEYEQKHCHGMHAHKWSMRDWNEPLTSAHVWNGWCTFHKQSIELVWTRHKWVFMEWNVYRKWSKRLEQTVCK